MKLEDGAVFVYGTLLPGERNHGLLDGVTDRVLPAYADGLRLHDGPGFPYASRGEATDLVRGAVCFLRRGIDQLAMERLDSLEGYRPADPDRSHYVRERTLVNFRDPLDGDQWRSISAWVYLAGAGVDLSSKPRITSGDWITYARPSHHQSSISPVG